MSKYINADEQERIMQENEMIESNDWVEVVRCKNCKHSESVPKWKNFELACMLRREYTTPDDYCSQAERKETE